MVFLLELLLFLTAFAISQQQMCPPDNGQAVTVCTDDNKGWRSNISTASGSSNGGRRYEVMWDNDPNFPMTAPGGYVLVYRQFGSGTTQTLMPTRMNQGFAITNLRPDTRYDAMMCLPQSTPPNRFELSRGCGNCRLCFRTNTKTSPPIIVEATVQEIPQDMGLIYICEAVGDPLPNITWSAINLNGNRLQLENTTVVTITTEIMNEVASQLTLSMDADFIDLVCIADNGIGMVSENMFMMVSLPPSQQSISISTIIAIVVPTATIAILSPLLGIIFCLCCIRIHKRRGCRRHKTLTNPADDKTEVDVVAETYFLTRQESLLHNLPKSLIISPSNIQVSTVIGQGEFGVIYKGYLKSNMMDTVAIKTLKGIFATASDIESVSKEIEKMQHFKHPNVMSLIGVCMAPSEQGGSTGGPCIVMPFMAKGSLLDQLRKESDELNVTSEDDKNFGNVKKILLQMCLQIAKGMEYLAGQKFVHRDLAARNCLVDASGIIKVSDFGLAEDIYSQNYFRQVESGTKLPLKWMALESITQGKFTEKSDVWSYGITCWEVFTGGSMPYPGMHPREVLEFLENGERSGRPKNAACDSDMYKMMLSCWECKDTSRPSFSDIVACLTRNLEYASDYLDLTGYNNGPPTIIPNANCSEDGANLNNVSVSRLDSIPHTPITPNEYYIAN